MFAVIKLAGSQYKVKKNDIIKVNKINAEVGDEFVINDVLSLIDGSEIKLGTPILEGSSVTAKVIEQGRDKKVIVFKKQRRKHHRRKNGHRQYISMVEILDIK
jgi:large subunit ribosomal protein L21